MENLTFSYDGNIESCFMKSDHISMDNLPKWRIWHMSDDEKKLATFIIETINSHSEDRFYTMKSLDMVEKYEYCNDTLTIIFTFYSPGDDEYNKDYYTFEIKNDKTIKCTYVGLDEFDSDKYEEENRF